MARLQRPTSIYHHRTPASLPRRSIRVAHLQDPFPEYESCDAYPRRTSPSNQTRSNVTSDSSLAAYLDPIPHGRKERRRIDDSDGVQRFRVVGGRHRGRLLEVAPERPHVSQRRVREIDDARHRRYR